MPILFGLNYKLKAKGIRVVTSGITERNGKGRLPDFTGLTSLMEEGIISMGPVSGGAQRRQLREADHSAPIQAPPMTEGSKFKDIATLLQVLNFRLLALMQREAEFSKFCSRLPYS